MNNSRSKSTLFLIEQLIVIAVFAICATACVRILTDAYFSASESRDKSNAIHAAESGAESFKAAGGDIGKAAAYMGGGEDSTDRSGASAVVYYDKDWRVCGEDTANYRLKLSGARPDPDYPQMTICDLSVEKLGRRASGGTSDAEKIIEYSISIARKG